MLSLCLFLLLSLSARADWTTAKTETELRQGLQNLEWDGQRFNCLSIRIEGDWALGIMEMVGGTDGSAMFHRQGGRWTRFRLLGGRGPLSRLEMLRANVPSPVCAGFGYGQVKPEVTAALRDLGVQRSAELITLATHHSKVFGSLHFSKFSSIYEFVGGRWQPVFDFRWSESQGLKPIRQHGFSEYMGNCIQSGTAGRIDLQP